MNRPLPPNFKTTTKSTTTSPTKAPKDSSQNFYRGEEESLPSERLSLKSNFLSNRNTFKVKTSSSKREERRLKIPSDENKYINVPSTSKLNSPSQDLLFQREGNI